MFLSNRGSNLSLSLSARRVSSGSSRQRRRLLSRVEEKVSRARIVALNSRTFVSFIVMLAFLFYFSLQSRRDRPSELIGQLRRRFSSTETAKRPTTSLYLIVSRDERVSRIAWRISLVPIFQPARRFRDDAGEEKDDTFLAYLRQPLINTRIQCARLTDLSDTVLKAVCLPTRLERGFQFFPSTRNFLETRFRAL